LQLNLLNQEISHCLIGRDILYVSCYQPQGKGDSL
jgi:hypothetical protein